MGGEGSGRKPDIFNMITRQEDKVPIGNEIILPNYSGLREGAKKTDTEVMATRTYVDSQIAGENHWDMDLGQTVIYPHLGGINVSGSKCYWTDAYSTKLFVNTNTLTVSGSNVGIGTTSPGTKLVVNGTKGFIQTDVDTYTNTVLLNGVPSSSGNFDINNAVTGGITRLYATDKIQFRTGGADPAVTILNAGNVGIGTTGPGYPLDVNGESRFTGAAYFVKTSNTEGYANAALAGAGANWWIRTGTNYSYNLGVYNGGLPQLTAMTVLQNGNVGIGTTAPNYKLQVTAPGNSYDIVATDGTYNAGIFTGPNVIGSSGGVYFGSQNNYDAYFGANGAGGYLVVKPSGNVGIGTTTPVGKLHVSGSLVLTDSTSPTLASNEGCLFLSGGACWFKGGSGTVTLIANA